MADHELTVVGFQASGKTTFAAALWHLVDSGEVSDTMLMKGKHNGDFAYLEEIAGTWADGYAVERTKFEEFRPIRIALGRPDPELEVDLCFVDLSGETFERMFATRRLDERVDPLLRRADGLMLFVSAAQVRDDVSLLDVGLAMPDFQPPEPKDDEPAEGTPTVGQSPHRPEAQPPAGRDGDAGGEAAAAAVGEASRDVQEFKSAATPHQVQLVDLLDALSDDPVRMQPSRICIIISAWDQATKGQTPDGWLASRMPLLLQYLQTHADEIDFRIYGVSAQGGQVPTRKRKDDPSDRKMLLDKKIASHRIKVVGHDAGSHDLTHPVAWASGLEV